MRASEAIPLDHPLDGNPEYCCSGGKHNFHFRPGAPRTVGHLISCCCKSVMTMIEAEDGAGDPEAADRTPDARADRIRAANPAQQILYNLGAIAALVPRGPIRDKADDEAEHIAELAEMIGNWRPE